MSIENDIRQIDETIAELEEARIRALSNTINAEAASVSLMTDIYGEEDWTAMSENERREAINEDYDHEIASLETEREKLEEALEEQQEADQLADAIDKVVSGLVALGESAGLKADVDVSESTLSNYITFTNEFEYEGEEFEESITIRVSDHSQPAHGGMRWDSRIQTHYRTGEADIDVVVFEHRGKIDVDGLEEAEKAFGREEIQKRAEKEVKRHREMMRRQEESEQVRQMVLAMIQTDEYLRNLFLDFYRTYFVLKPYRDIPLKEWESRQTKLFYEIQGYVKQATNETLSQNDITYFALRLARELGLETK